PSQFHFTKSPVRYNRPPSSPSPPPSPANTSGINLSAVHSARFTYPRPTPTPPIHNSPPTPTGTGSISSSKTYNRVLPIGRPIGTPPPCPASSFSPVSPPVFPFSFFIQGHALTSMLASVGPYRLCNSTPPSFSANLFRWSSSSASPLQITRFNPPHLSTPSCSSHTLSIDGTKCTVVIPR